MPDITPEDEEEMAIQRSESNETTGTMRIHTPQTSHQPGQPGRRSTPSPMMKGLSTALMQGAFEKFGQAFTATGDVKADRANDQGRMQGFRDAGATVASRLEDRWFRMEYENFQSNEVEPFIAAKRRSLDDFKMRNDLLNEGRVPGPDGQIQQFDLPTPAGRDMARRARSALFQEFYSVNADMDMSLANEAYKYSHNPIIDSRIQAIVEAGSKQLMQIASPPGLDAQVKEQGMRLADEGLQIDQQRADTAAAQVRLAKTQASRDQSIGEALKDPAIGLQGILPWIETGHGRGHLAGPAAAAYLEEGKAIMTAQLHQQREAEQRADGTLKDGDEYYAASDDNTAAVQSIVSQNGAALQRAAAVELVRAADPQAAIDAEKYSPQFYELVANAESATGQKKIITDKRLSKAEIKNNIGAWKRVVDHKLKEYMENPANDPSMDAVLAEIVDVWLPQAITGAIRSPAGANIMANQSKATEGYRNQIAAEMRKYITDEAYKKNTLLEEMNPEAVKRAKRKRASGLGSRGRRRARLLGPE